MNSSGLSRKRLLAMQLLALTLLLLTLSPRPLQADDIEKQMRELLADAGPFPEAITRPRDPVRNELSVYERLNRIWHRLLGFRVTYATARGKACHANQRVIAGAVEMHNMDNATMMTTLRHADTAAAGVLVSGLYLKSPIQPPESDCEYLSFGDLTKNGIVYCRRHGADEPYYKAVVKITGISSQADRQAVNLQIAFAGLVGLILVSLVVMLVLFFNRRQPSEPSEPGK